MRSSRTPEPSDAIERAFVYAVFFAMLAGLAGYVWFYGRNLFFFDDWESVPVLSGSRPFSFAWLWTQQNEHRFPIARAVTFCVWRSVGDLRVVMLLSNLVVSAVTFGLIQTARQCRGRMSYTDAFFPLVLLHWGMHENLIFASQLFFVSAPALALAILLVALGAWHGHLARVVGMGVCLVLLPLNGAIGLALLPGSLALLACLGVSRLRATEPSNRRDGSVLLASCGIAAGVAAGYFIGFEPNPQIAGARSVADAARTVLEILSLSIGSSGSQLWPAAAIGTIGTIAVAVRFAAKAAVSRPHERERALAVLFTMAAFTLLIVAVGYGRAALGAGQGFANRYAIFSAPLLCCSYLSMSLFAKDGWGRALRTLLSATLAAACVINTRDGIRYGIDRADRADALLAAIEAGASPAVAAARNWERLYPNEALLAERLEMLRRQGSGPYAGRTE